MQTIYGHSPGYLDRDQCLGVSLPLATMALIVAALVVLNILTWIAPAPPPRYEPCGIAVHLGIDLAAICGLPYFSGGIANPFSLLLVLHVVLMALLPALAPAAATTLVATCFVMQHLRDRTRAVGAPPHASAQARKPPRQKLKGFLLLDHVQPSCAKGVPGYARRRC